MDEEWEGRFTMLKVKLSTVYWLNFKIRLVLPDKQYYITLYYQQTTKLLQLLWYLVDRCEVSEIMKVLIVYLLTVYKD